jgi:hypothetical protein
MNGDLEVGHSYILPSCSRGTADNLHFPRLSKEIVYAEEGKRT